MASFQKRNIIYHQAHRRNPLFPRPVESKGIRRKIITFLILVFIAGLIYLLFFSPYFVIKNIEIKGNKYLKTEDIKKIAEDALKTKRYLVLEQNHYFALLRGDLGKTIEAELQKSIALQSFKIKTKFPSRLTIELKEKIPYLSYVANDQYYYLDREGTIAQAVDQASLGTDFPLVHDANNPVAVLKEKIISDKLTQFIFDINKAMADKTDIAVDSFVIPKIECQAPVIAEETDNLNTSVNVNSSKLNKNVNSNANVNTNENLNSNINSLITNEAIVTKECNLRELEEHLTDIQVKTGEGWLIYFESDNDLNQQINNLITLTKQLKVTKNLEYIDLRFGTKVYYK